ncbi:radical S-adenosyl methionine domain-containing protein 1, mitochondrial-like [Diadema antillarum]|uniref:radical S-adenosyl methionine domain-containing protein 1, mitochondrial-like n=1 Tax=Diadema antillarum TaxID=105358 RepID=UPI003A89179C
MKHCLVTELKTLLGISGIKRVTSIFFGGGTPNLARPDVLGAVIETANQFGIVSEGTEISMEANPTALEAQKLLDFNAIGINRLSLGIQAINNADLKLLGRDHTVEQSLACVDRAKALYPGHVSLDVIFGRPGQSLNAWLRELHQILTICDDHLSLYQLTLEPGTALYRLNKEGVMSMPDEDTLADMYEAAVDAVLHHGFHRYEVSNFARGIQAESVHNKAYWAGKQYIGVGPGAHGRFCPVIENIRHPKVSDSSQNLTSGRAKMKPVSQTVPTSLQREARIQTLEPQTWMEEVEKYGHGTRRAVVQSNFYILQEFLLMALRTPSGISNLTWQQFLPGGTLMEVFGLNEFVREAVQTGLVELDDIGLRCTGRGLCVLDSIIPPLITCLTEHFRGKP